MSAPPGQVSVALWALVEAYGDLRVELDMVARERRRDAGVGLQAVLDRLKIAERELAVALEAYR